MIIVRVQEGRATWARSYLEPVDKATTNVDDAVSAQVHADNPT